MKCYKDFAHIYDELINKDIDYKSWVQTILKNYDELNMDRKDYLDLGCGTGNITELIAAKFVSSWAVDLSYDMLTEAETKMRSKGIKVKFVCQDITQLNLNKKFNLITCCLDSTNYILEEEKLIAYFKGIHNHLKDNGIFIFDMNSYYKLTKILGNNIYNYDDENVTYIWENFLEDDIVDMYLTFFVKQGEYYRRFDEEHSERAYKHERVCELLKLCGLELVKVMDNYEEKIISHETERITYIVKKANEEEV
ncbi:SAM-dependent methyltransferase [Clostridium carboxidivorans P7]|uniref:Methyltransferase type 12 n=1 Tax=Clostridium carboxidivorans P7 TaxID=536227 RepID=C6PZ70_9CLOT|nr:class I SAM-dependent methyltransferase [Clostridium carboxidivorans]AKN32553.1 SAM-dependent methyltransferase [Clostridium carboxidivorans P7]EET85468.1 Methyltransferase type 12 [Clostridium carboxidivorans P7]EFG87716.1 methyltransferase domain protein [Clostridium carboxidivorans P7]